MYSIVNHNSDLFVWGKTVIQIQITNPMCAKLYLKSEIKTSEKKPKCEGKQFLQKMSLYSVLGTLLHPFIL